MAHILVVDDDGDLRALLKTALERDGHQVSLLDRGGAVSEAHCRWADCILLDVMMPGEDGFATCRRIRALAACPILFLTAKTEEADVLTERIERMKPYLLNLIITDRDHLRSDQMGW